MRTKEDFNLIHNDFNKTIYGKAGTDFFNAVFKFMRKHHFEHNVQKLLLENDTWFIMLFTDHIANDVGIIYIENKKTRPLAFSLVEDKHAFIQKFIDNLSS